jgi:hypothetical protein
MIEALVAAGFLQVDDVLRRLDHANLLGVAFGRAAEIAGFLVSEVVADRASAQAALGFGDCLRQPLDVLGRLPQQMKASRTAVF